MKPERHAVRQTGHGHGSGRQLPGIEDQQVALLSLPTFGGGQRAAQEEGAKARLEAAVVAQRGQVLGAFRDVEDQLSALRLLAGQAQVLDQAVESAERASHLSDVRYRNGFVSQLELLDARRSALRQRRNALQVRTAQYTTTVMLIRALGGVGRRGLGLCRLGRGRPPQGASVMASRAT